jgi:ParB family chromosome partitioning protein
MSNKRAVNAPRRDVFLLDPSEVKIIGIDTDHKSKADHYLWDPRIKLPIDEGLVNNIRTYGVIKPILVVKDGDDILVADGRQRALHCRVAAQRAIAAGEEPPKLPVMFKRGEESYIFGISRAANLHRPESIIDRANNAQRMLDMGADEAEVAITFGIKVSTLKTAWLPLLSLAPKVRNAVEKGEVAPAAAVTLASLSKADQEAHLDELRAEGVKPTVDNVTNKVRRAKGKSEVQTPKQRITAALALITKLYEEANTIVGEGSGLEAQDYLNQVAKVLSGKTAAELIDAEVSKKTTDGEDEDV